VLKTQICVTRLQCVNNLPPGMQSYSKPLLLTDGTSVLITANNVEDLKLKYAPVLNGVSKWFLVIGLSLNILRYSSLAD
jgi:type VI protein secretion system component VasA